MKFMKKITLLIWVIIVGAAGCMLFLYPYIANEARHAYDENVKLEKEVEQTETSVLYDSERLFQDMMRYSTPLYLELVKSIEPTKSNSELLVNTKLLSDVEQSELEGKIATEKSLFMKDYGKVKYYIANKDGKVHTNDDTIKAYLDATYEDTSSKSWHLAYHMNDKGNFELRSTNSTYFPDSQEDLDRLRTTAIVDFMLNKEVSLEFTKIRNTDFVFVINESDIVQSVEVSSSSNTAIEKKSYYNAPFYDRYVIVSIIMVGILLCIPYRKAKESKLVQTFTKKIPYEITGILVIFSYIFASEIGCTLMNDVSYFIFGMLGMVVSFTPIAMIAFICKEFRSHEEGIDPKYNSLLWRYSGKIKKICKEVYHYVTTIDLTDKTTKRIMGALLINFIIISFFTLFWLAGVFFLFGYSIFLYYLISSRIAKQSKDFKALQEVIERIADGDFKKGSADKLGIYEPLNKSLQDIQDSFHEAVLREVQSQNMKTELITNVSHDLKTPLTSIISYIDLLKRDDLSEEDRAKYINVLEKSSDRLKHLIENLFEISKANSGDINVDYREVDIVSLMKQVQLECDSIFSKRQLEIRNTFSDEKITLQLDSQKTYRIFENLLSNAGKYALVKTRIYVIIEDFGEVVDITIKNISANELDFDSEEIMERFTRGDKSRNTEGSGLGLAIAKSFTELQHGTMKITFDGDLFKVSVRLHKQNEQ